MIEAPSAWSRHSARSVATEVRTSWLAFYCTTYSAWTGVLIVKKTGPFRSVCVNEVARNTNRSHLGTPANEPRRMMDMHTSPRKYRKRSAVGLAITWSSMSNRVYCNSSSVLQAVSAVFVTVSLTSFNTCPVVSFTKPASITPAVMSSASMPILSPTVASLSAVIWLAVPSATAAMMSLSASSPAVCKVAPATAFRRSAEVGRGGGREGGGKREWKAGGGIIINH